jgi:hypothetical protein
MWATSRLPNVSIKSVTKLILIQVGMAVADYEDRTVKKLPRKRVQFGKIGRSSARRRDSLPIPSSPKVAIVGRNAHAEE